MNCKYCGKEMNAGEFVCESCGRSVTTMEEQSQLPFWGFVLVCAAAFSGVAGAVFNYLINLPSFLEMGASMHTNIIISLLLQMLPGVIVTGLAAAGIYWLMMQGYIETDHLSWGDLAWPVSILLASTVTGLIGQNMLINFFGQMEYAMYHHAFNPFMVRALAAAWAWAVAVIYLLERSENIRLKKWHGIVFTVGCLISVVLISIFSPGFALMARLLMWTPAVLYLVSAATCARRIIHPGWSVLIMAAAAVLHIALIMVGGALLAIGTIRTVRLVYVGYGVLTALLLVVYYARKKNADA